jgi:tryptophan synthase alpha chain
MNRIKETFNQLKKNNKKALGIFLTAGDPDFESSLNLIQQLPQNGVDFIEIGMPFSDPMADGPSIQLSSQRALKSGMNLIKCLSLVEKFRKLNTHTPIILMGYYNPIYKFGKEKFIQLCLNSGVDGLIIVDLPPEEDEEFYIEAEKNKLSIIRLVTPTTNQKRLNKILFNATGFVYYVSITGITGTQAPNIENVSKNLEKIKSVTDLPVVIGFGIRSPSQALSMANISDGIVVGSAVVDLIKSSLDKDDNPTKNTLNSCLDFIGKVSKSIKHN